MLNTGIIRKIALGSLALAFTALAAAMPSQAEESYQNTRITVGYGWNNQVDTVFGTGTSDEEVALLEFEHYGVWKYGDNYFDVNIWHGDNIGAIPLIGLAGGDSTFFALWVSRLSLTKTTGHNFSFGLIKDVYLAGRIEKSDYFDFHSENIGISVDLAIPGAAFFETDLFFRRYDFTGATDNNAILSRTFAIFPFKIYDLDFKWEQLLLLTFRDDDRDLEVYSRSDVTMRIPNTTLDIGVRLEHHRYGGILGVDNPTGDNEARTTPYAIARWNF